MSETLSLSREHLTVPNFDTTQKDLQNKKRSTIRTNPLGYLEIWIMRVELYLFEALEGNDAAAFILDTTEDIRFHSHWQMTSWTSRINPPVYSREHSLQVQCPHRAPHLIRICFSWNLILQFFKQGSFVIAREKIQTCILMNIHCGISPWISETRNVRAFFFQCFFFCSWGIVSRTLWVLCIVKKENVGIPIGSVWGFQNLDRYAFRGKWFGEVDTTATFSSDLDTSSTSSPFPSPEKKPTSSATEGDNLQCEVNFLKPLAKNKK